MKYLTELINNHILITAAFSWLVAQIIKTMINFHFTRKIDWERMVGSGGMPSCHSATVSALFTVTTFFYGPGSFEFAVTAILAIIVMYDARGVRRETGKQAVLLNQIRDYLLYGGEKKGMAKPDFSDENLKELVGHTPLQVIVGAILGITIGVLSGIFWK
ncbi:MAG: divergent PAP2 family protein [Lachnospiraceae bacterium]|nr:divergent PAP2 family protein [Lachnospiraceae bacterium]